MGQLGEGWSKRGPFTSNLRGRWTIPVTAGGCQVSRREHKGEAKRDKQELARGKGKQGELRLVYMLSYYMCIRMTERLNNISYRVYNNNNQMNVVDNLNSV